MKESQPTISKDLSDNSDSEYSDDKNFNKKKNTEPRKRGRPRKNQEIPKVIEQAKKVKNIKHKEEEDIILHLPLDDENSEISDNASDKKINDDVSDKKINDDVYTSSLKNDQKIKSHDTSFFNKSTVDNNTIGQNKFGIETSHITNEAIEQKQKKNTVLSPEVDESEKNTFTMKDDTDTYKPTKVTSILSISDKLSDSDQNDDNINVQNLLKEISRKDAIIKKLKEASNIINPTNQFGQSNEYASYGYDGDTLSIKEVSNHHLDLKLIDIKNGKPIVIEKTNIVCWWDTCNFDTIPCFIPDKYYNNKYYVFGCFCSFNCALAYNMNMNDYRAQTRHSLIKKLCSHLYSSTDPVIASPEREILEKFGGNITIEDFRNKSILLRKEYKLTLPPMIPLIPIIEESTRDSNIIVPAKVNQYKARGNKYSFNKTSEQ